MLFSNILHPHREDTVSVTVQDEVTADRTKKTRSQQYKIVCLTIKSSSLLFAAVKRALLLAKKAFSPFPSSFHSLPPYSEL